MPFATETCPWKILALWILVDFYLYTYVVFSSQSVSLHKACALALGNTCCFCALACLVKACCWATWKSEAFGEYLRYLAQNLRSNFQKKRCRIYRSTSSKTPKQEPHIFINIHPIMNYYHYNIYIYISIQHHLPYKWTITYNNQQSTTWHLSSWPYQETGGAGSCKAPRELSVHIAKLLSYPTSIRSDGLKFPFCQS